MDPLNNFFREWSKLTITFVHWSKMCWVSIHTQFALSDSKNLYTPKSTLTLLACGEMDSLIIFKHF